MLATLLQFATVDGGHDTDKTAFYVLGGLLALWAVVVAGLGILRHETFPPSEGGKVAVMVITTLLVVAVAAASILTS